jgi:hypothetical protein
MLYPNPAQSYVSVFMKDAKVGDTMVVYDLNGRAVLRATVEGPVTKLMVGALPSGMYVLHLGQEVAKFSKE